jgi:indole-3-glycerol phosphate synthase
MSILDEIVGNKRLEIAVLRKTVAIDELKSQAAAGDAPPSFSGALRSVPMGLIAEVKRRSPSAGCIREPFHPAEIATSYEQAGAQAVSVLMDERYFGGGAEDFRAVRDAVALPMLYKEFVVDPWQIWHARAIGASAVLLIAGVLDVKELLDFRTSAESAGVECLVEVHDESQMKMASDARAALIGVNNRNLKDFTVSLETSERLLDHAPDGCTLVSESGIRSAADVLRVQRAGYHAVLVGEHLLRENDLGAAVRGLMGSVWMSS